MKQLFIIIAILCCWLPLSSQSTATSQPNETHEASVELVKWVANLYEFGVKVGEDSIVISAEIQNMLNNETLRDFMYPDTYQWETTMALLQQMELKRALWFMINLYPENKEVAIKAIVKYDHLFEMDRALLAALYTYAFVDPEVCTIIDGKLIINRPDLAEKKLDTVNEMIKYVLYYREQRVGQTN